MGVEVQVALFDDGPVRRELEAVADVRRMPDLARRSPLGVAESIARRADTGADDRVHDLRTAAARRWLRPPDCIHLHGPLASPLLRYVRTPGVPVTTYVHPWDFRITGLPPRDQRRVVDRTDRFFTADDTVVGDLLAAGVDPSRIEPAPTTFLFPPPSVPASARARARARIGLDPTAVVVGVPPVVDWVDAPDLTLLLAWELERRLGPTAPTLLWYGMPTGGDRPWPLVYDMDRMGLSSLHLAEELPVGIDLLDLVDVLVLPTRTTEELPEGLAERAAAHHTPLVCWGGHPLADEVVRWKGRVMPPGDVAAMATFLAELVVDPVVRRRLEQEAWSERLAEVERITPLAVPVPAS